MADLRPTDKRVLERLFEMGGGYVCDFTNRTFQEFVLDVTGIDVYEERYSAAGESKANRLRTFWRLERNHVVAKLLEEMISYEAVEVVRQDEPQEELEDLRERASQLVARLREGIEVADLGVFADEQQDSTFEALARQIQESVDNGRPEEALDRLHTYLTRYSRALCDRHAIEYSRSTPLHALFGSYVRYLRENELVESKASLTILSSSIKVLDDLNKVRNDQSLAHDNSLLNRNEATLIFRNISTSVKFIRGLERRIQEQAATEERDWSDPEFTDEEIDAAGDRWIQEQIDIARGK